MTQIHVLGGGTFSHVRPHLALAAPAFGETARFIYNEIVGSRLTEDAQGEPEAFFKGASSHLWLTRMARGGSVQIPPVGDLGVTNDDVAEVVSELVQNQDTKVIFFSVALCDYTGSVLDPESGGPTPSGKDQPRLKTSGGPQVLELKPAQKIIGGIRKHRKDIFLVGFKTTAGANPQEQYEAGLLLLKKNSCNLVLANDVQTRLNMVVVPELGRYHETTNRREALLGLIDMASRRAGLTFTRTTVMGGPLIPWNSLRIPRTLRNVVHHCLDEGAYKPFQDVTVGHFGYMPELGKLYSSRRKQNYNRTECLDLVEVDYDGLQLTAHGAKPSAGTTSQMAVLSRFFPRFDCIVHFHCPLRPGADVTVRPQYAFECGSHECGTNTLEGMRIYGKDAFAAVMLDQHGPNIIFHHDASAEKIIRFIDQNFDLSKRTGDT